MKKLGLFILLSVMVTPLFAQDGNRAMSFDVTGVVSFITFSDKELVPPNRRGKTNLGSEYAVNAYYEQQLKTGRVTLKAGIGISGRQMTMRKNNFEDFLVSIFGGGTSSSFSLQSVRFTPRYINIPIGVSFQLPKRKSTQVSLGIMLGSSFVTNRKVTVEFDSSSHIPTNADIQQAKATYEKTISSYTLSIQPRMDFDFELSKGMGLRFNACPFMYYLKPWNSLSRNSFSFYFSGGLYYKF